MRTKVTLVLIFLNVALFFFIFKFERNWRTEAAQTEARRRVLGPEAADIRFLEVTSTSANGSFRLERRRDTWFLTKPLDWPANPHAASAIVQELQLLDHKSAFAVSDLAKNSLSLADYGLDKPKITVEFSSNDPAAPGAGTRPTTKLWIGDTTKDGKLLYILSPDRARIHIVNRSLLDSLSLPIDQLRADTLLSIRIYETRSFSVIQSGNTDPARGSTTTPIRVRIRNDGSRWTFEAPHTARASKTEVELAINELNSLHAKSFPASAPSPSVTPTLRIILEAYNRAETLFIGDPVPSAKPTAGGATEYYAQLEGRNAIFTVAVSPKLMDKLRNAQETLRETRILEFDASAVTKIELASPMQPNQPPLTLQRLETPPGQPANVAPPWQVVVRRSDGAQGPQTLPADRVAVQRLLEKLSLLTADKFKSDAPTSADLEEWGFNRPSREVTLTLAGASAPITLRIGNDVNRSAYYARVDTPSNPGTSIYQINPEIESEIQLNPAAWRDRAVGEPLPAAARIRSLKITDLQRNEVLFETNFDAAGEPSAARDPKAARDVAAALRALRAREFLPGGFVDRITAAGDERPWRFQLEAAIAVPGPAGAEQTNTTTLFLTERLGGAQQFAGSKEHDTVFSLEQPLIDALWSLTYGNRDPGPRSEQKK